MSYDALDRMVTRKDALGGVTTVAYDAVGNTRSLTDPVGNTTTWTYDALDRVTTRTDPTNTSATFAYDAAGQLRSATDRLGRRVDYGYDGVGRLASEVWLTSGATVQLQTWTYDAAGRMLTAQDPDGVYTLGYDTADRVTSVHEPFGAALTFAYDAVGNRIGVQDSGGGVTTVTFDALNRQTEEEFGGSGLTKLKESRTYTAAGEVSLVTRQAWVSAAWSTAGTTSYAYDGAGQVTKITHIKSRSAVASYVYSYDAAGRLSSEVLNGTSRTYSYDANGQLTADAGTAYGYDANGNRNTSGYATGAANRVTTDGTWTYTYDAEGNVTKRSKGASSDTWVYTYDHRNQLASSAYSATDGGTVTQRVTNTYDAWGNKVQRAAWDGSTTTTERYAVDGWDPAKNWAVGVENFDTWADLNGSNAITMRRGFGPGFDELSWRQTSGGTAGWYLTDRLGSVRGVTGGTGTPLTTLTYSGWEAVLSNSTPAQSDAYQFTGRTVDPATGLRNHRDRDTPGNQWLQEDPSGLAPDVNNRRYVGNSPTNYRDPSGHDLIQFTPTAPVGGSVTSPTGNFPTTGGPSGQDVLGMAGLAPPPVHDDIFGLVPELEVNPLTGLTGSQSGLLNSLFGMGLPGMEPVKPPSQVTFLTYEQQEAIFQERYAYFKALLDQLRAARVVIGPYREQEIWTSFDLAVQLGMTPAAAKQQMLLRYGAGVPQPKEDLLRTVTDYVGYASIVIPPLSIGEAALELMQNNPGAAALALAGVLPVGKPLKWVFGRGGEAAFKADDELLKAYHALHPPKPSSPGPFSASGEAFAMRGARVSEEWARRRWLQDLDRIEEIARQMQQTRTNEAIAIWRREAMDRAKDRRTSRATSDDLPPWPAPWERGYNGELK